MTKRAVVTDDSAFMRLTLISMLESLGYEVVGEGSDGRNAVSLYKQLKPDLITMDITMPGMDGIWALKEILAFDPAAKVIMVSAMGQKDKVIDAVSAGAIDFVVKPFRPERLDEALARIEGREPGKQFQQARDKKETEPEPGGQPKDSYKGDYSI